MIGPLSLSVVLLLHPMEPHARMQVQVDPDFGLESAWAARWHFASLVRAESPEGIRGHLRMVYVAPGVLEISLPARLEGAIATINLVADKAVPAALARWESSLKRTLADYRFDIKETLPKAEKYRQMAAIETSPARRAGFLAHADNLLNRIPELETRIDRMERSLAQGLPRATVVGRAQVR